MELIFEHSQKVTDGHTPAAYHSPDNVVQVFYTDEAGRIHTIDAETPRGNFADREFSLPHLAAPDEGAQSLSVSYLPRMNFWTVWRSGDLHRMGAFLLKQETNKYLVDGSLQFNADDPGVTLSLTLENPKGIIAAEDAVEVPPGTRIGVYFKMGESSKVHLGNYYLDRIVTKVGDPQVTLSARNAVGKLLKDQSFDEDNTFSGTVTAVLTEILEAAGIRTHRIEFTADTISIEFQPNTSYYDGLQAIISTRPGWEIREDVSGTIVIGGPAHIEQYMPAGVYQFERGRDCLSREVTRDDRETYARVCVHDREFTVAVWRNVDFIEGWNLPAKKTLYVEAPEGTTEPQATAIAEHLAGRLAQVGVIEAFVAPFRPQLQPGDQADIIEPGKLARTIGTLTQVGLQFGRGGFYTSFTVDSGGVIKKPRLKDLIEQIGGKTGGAKITG